MYWEEFEDTKGATRICISKNRQHNGQKKKYKRTNNDLQNIGYLSHNVENIYVFTLMFGQTVFKLFVFISASSSNLNLVGPPK